MQQDAAYTRTCSHAWANVHKRTGPRVLTVVLWCAMQSMRSMMIQRSVWAASLQRMPKPVKSGKLVTDMGSSSCQILRMIMDDLPLLRCALFCTDLNPEPATQLPAYVTEHLPRSRKWCWNSFEDIRNGTWIDMDGHETLEQTRTEFSELSRVAKTHLKDIGHLMEKLKLCKTDDKKNR